MTVPPFLHVFRRQDRAVLQLVIVLVDGVHGGVLTDADAGVERVTQTYEKGLWSKCVGSFGGGVLLLRMQR